MSELFDTSCDASQASAILPSTATSPLEFTDDEMDLSFPEPDIEPKNLLTVSKVIDTMNTL